jgi:hypothetical protein
MSLFFLFVQFEFTHAVGPHAGRYVVSATPSPEDSTASAAEGPPARLSVLETRNRDVAGVTRDIGGSDVLVMGVISASTASMPRLRRKARPAESDAQPADVPLSVVTFVRGTEPIPEQRSAAQLLDAIRGSEQEQNAWVAEGLKVLNTAIRAHRAGAHDPYAIEVTRRDARRIRVGFGSTEEVGDGRWTQALQLPPPPGRRTKRVERLRPSEAVAAVLSGRTAVLESEDLLLRALVDLDNNRTRAAAYQVGAALRLLPGELGREVWEGTPEAVALAARAADLEKTASARALEAGEVAELEEILDAVDGALDTLRYERVS